MRVDHLVWYGADLEAGQRFFAERMDSAPTYGGVHPGEGTGNFLLSLSDQTYVEILGRDPAQPEASLDAELRALGSDSGLYHWAAGGADLEELRDRAQRAGLAGSELVTGGRTLPNGNWLGWKLFGVKNHGFGALVPFFIDWMESAHPAKTTPRGGSLVSVEAYTPAPRQLGEIYQALGLDIAVHEAAAPGLAVTVESRRGRHTLRTFDKLPRGYVI